MVLLCVDQHCMEVRIACYAILACIASSKLVSAKVPKTMYVTINDNTALAAAYGVPCISSGLGHEDFQIQNFRRCGTLLMCYTHCAGVGRPPGNRSVIDHVLQARAFLCPPAVIEFDLSDNHSIRGGKWKDNQ